MNTLDYTGTKFIYRPTDLPTIGGDTLEKGKPGLIVQLYIGGNLFEVPVDPKTGLFTWTATEPFLDGDYSVSIRTLDRAGNLGKPSLRTLRIDTTPPPAPELLFLTDDQGPKTGLLEAGQTTDDKRPKLTGIAQEDAIVYLRDADGNTIGSARADKVTGKWEIEPRQDLEEGVNNLVLVAEETFAGVTREGAPSASFKIIIGADSGILPPDTITITQAIDDQGSATGVLSNGALTDDTTPTLNGVVSAGSTVTVYYRLAGSDMWAGSATATVTGENWTWTPGSALPTGTYEFQASIGSTSSALFLLDIAASADDIQKKTRIESAQDDFGTWQGPLSNGAITDDTTPTLSGRGEANGKVVIRYGVPANTVVVDVDSSGHWTWTPAPALTAGNWNFDVQPQGHTKWSETFSLSITDANGFKPVITHAYDDVGTPSNLANGDTTDDTTPTLHGRAEANSTLTLRYRSGTGSYASVQVEADSAGNWTWTPPALQNGSWSFEVQKAGQSDWDSLSLTIDTTSDRNPVIDYAADNVGNVRDPLSSGDTTDDSTPTLHGTAAANSEFSLRYRLNSGSWTTVKLTADSKGDWSWTSPTLQNGNWNFAVQKAGQSGWSNFSLTIEQKPDVPVLVDFYDNVGTPGAVIPDGEKAKTDDSTPTLRGTGTPNSTIYIQSAKEGDSWGDLGMARVDSSGNWEYTPSALANALWQFRVKASNSAGDSAWAQKVYLTIDSSLDRSPVIEYAADNVGSKQDNVFSGGTTDDTTPTLHGTTANNGMVYLKAVNGTDSQVFSFKADSAGKWQWTPPSNLALGDWTFQVSKNAGSDWGTAFNLTLKQNNKEGEVDFEHIDDGLTYNTDHWLNSDKAHNIGMSFIRVAGSGKKYVELVSTDHLGEPSLGNYAAKLSINEKFTFGTERNESPISYLKDIAEFSIQIFNPSSSDKSLLARIGIENGVNTSAFSLTLKAGLNTFTQDDVPASLLKKGAIFSWFQFENTTRDDLLIDNFHWKLNSVDISSINTASEYNGNLQLDGIEELYENNIFGREDKIDTLQLNGKDQLLDLTALSSKIESVEIFDITGTGDNTLKLDLNALLQHGEKDLFIEDGKTQLVVNGNEGDVVQLVDILPEGSDISEWQHQDGTVTVAGVEYQVYSHNDAELLVQQGVKTELI